MKQQLIKNYQAVRQKTQELCLPLTIEDFVIQSTDDVSPPKWHLAHTSWFFETFVLIPYIKNYQPFHPSFHYLFNSYYQTLGQPYPRPQRGLLSRPTVKEIMQYRVHVDNNLIEWLTKPKFKLSKELENIIQLGLQHEQQHQELLLMDIKHNFSINPLNYAYQTELNTSLIKPSLIEQPEFIYVEGGIIEIGNKNREFCFDNEMPSHHHFLKPYLISTHLVKNKDFCDFIADGGYQNPKWWLSDGWECVLQNHWQAPLYWQMLDGKWQVFTLRGLKQINLAEPVCHVSFYEADAYARWAGKRLPLETEWEHFATLYANMLPKGNFLESGYYHPHIAEPVEEFAPRQLLGDVWEWTASAYSPYPGFKPSANALGEYNGKFMVNQMVLRGGSCVTPQSHIRLSYRNFFQTEKRWQFSGIRLAADE
jgi:ergothioneine biosynthesis protein EgtB